MKGLWVRDYPVDILVGTNSVSNNGSQKIFSFRGNSIYDPDFTSGSAADSSVYWGSEINDQYYQYCVHAAKIKICGYVRKLSGSNYNPIRVYLLASDQTSPPANESAILLHPFHKTKIVDPVLSSNAGANGWFSMTMKKRSKDIFSRKLIEDVTNDGGYTGGTGTGSNPINNWFYHLVLYNNYPGYNGGAQGNVENYFVWFRVKIIYYTRLSDRKDVATGGYFGTNIPA